MTKGIRERALLVSGLSVKPCTQPNAWSYVLQPSHLFRQSVYSTSILSRMESQVGSCFSSVRTHDSRMQISRFAVTEYVTRSGLGTGPLVYKSPVRGYHI